VRLAAEADGAVASAPREALSQALLNIILNAVAHSPRGEVVEVRARAEGGAVAVTVRDHGPGIPAEERARIWEPFYTRGGGTGLGLAVVRRLAREHGWEVAVDDAPGGGTEFALRVPARPRTQTESA
jgi:signal transduction histidine kinase